MNRSAISLPLFPLQSVLFPGGLLSLKIFEARYLDLMSACLRERQPFGVVALEAGGETKAGAGAVKLEKVGCLAELLEVESPQQGILQVRCRGTERFEIESAEQRGNGLWVAEATPLPSDESLLPPQELVGSAKGLASAIASLREQGNEPFLEPYRFDDVGWLANRWCEILPISLAAKQKLMELPDPLVRLRLVDDYLRSKGVVA